MHCFEEKTLLRIFLPPSDSAPGALRPPCYSPGLTLCNKVRSCEICRVLNVRPLFLIERTQLKLSHVSRMPNERLLMQALLAKPMGKRLSCCPKPRWHSCTSDLAWSHLGVKPAELSEIAIDREVFQVLLWMLAPQPSLEKKQAVDEWTSSFDG